MKKVFAFSLLTLLLGCFDNRGDKQHAAKRYDIAQGDSAVHLAKEIIVDNGEEEGWGADLRISITQVIKTDSLVTYKAVGISEGRSVGIQISVPAAAPEDVNNLAQLMTIKSVGEASDNLLLLLHKLYTGTATSKNKFVSSKAVAFIDLNEFAKSKFGQALESSDTVKAVKVFFESGNEDDYAELYININEKEKWLEIREKDEGYRKQVLKALSSL